MTEILWQKFEKSLEDKQSLGKKITFWWRDDDLIEQTFSLEKLVDLSVKYEMPINLAVIPEPLNSDLPTFLKNQKNFHYIIWQHGIAHQNKAPLDEKKTEFYELNSKQLDQLLFLKEKLQNSFQEKFVPVFVPPWNRYHLNWEPIFFKHFKEISIEGVSSQKKFRNIHVNFKKEEQILEQLLVLIEKDITTIGFLTHHLALDEKMWLFLEKFLKFLAIRKKS